MARLRDSLVPSPTIKAASGWMFDRIDIDQSWVDTVRRFSAQGTVVYVLRNLSWIDYLALDRITARNQLPKIRFANDLAPSLIGNAKQSLPELLKSRSPAGQAEALQRALGSGGSAAIFLRKPPGTMDIVSGASEGSGLSHADALLRGLLSLQRRQDRPILLVPQVFVWTNRPEQKDRHSLDFILGTREWPGSLRTMAQFAANYQHVQLRAGEPINLAQLLSQAEDTSDEAIIRRLNYSILRRLESERRTVTGPASKTPERVKREILQGTRLQKRLKQLSEDTGIALDDAKRQADEILSAMQAKPDRTTLRALELTLDRVFHRIYAGIEIDEAGLEKIRVLLSQGTVLLLPSHKSHIDYLIPSYVFNKHNLQLPLIAAGDNMSFFPFGGIARRAGAFFIRRSFKGDPVYPVVVDAYLRRMIRDGYPIEMFLEGGRSRTGKLLPPKFGLLKMTVNSALAVPQQKVFFVPISIGYERIIETSAFEAELHGGEKKKEDASGLLGATDVLRHRYGRLNLQFGNHLTLDQIRGELGQDLRQEIPSEDDTKEIITRLGNRVMDEINRVTAITPGALTAIALMSYHRRGLTHEKLIRRAQNLHAIAESLGARTTPSLLNTKGQVRPDSIREAAQMFVNGGLVLAHAPAVVGSSAGRAKSATEAGPARIYTIPEGKRMELDTSKNIILHFFVERALVACAMVVPPGPQIGMDALRDRVQLLSKLFKFEFRYRADATFEEIFQSTVEEMIEVGEISRSGDGQLVAGPGHHDWSGVKWLLTYAALLRSYLESYRIAARGIGALLDEALSEKDLVKKSLATGNRMYLSGELERPEAVSKSAISNGFASLLDMGYLEKEDDMLRLSPDFANPEAVRVIENSIGAFLDREVHG